MKRLLPVGALLLFLAFVLRAANMNNHFFQAEFLYYYSALASQDFKDFYVSFGAGQGQPFLEPVLRKMLWFPLLGYSERSLRLPGLIYGLGLVGFALGFGWWYFRKREKRTPSVALLFGVFCASCFAVSPLQIYLVGIGRHYTFIWLIATLWSVYFIFTPQPRLTRFSAASFAFMNTHLFSLPLIASAFGWLGLNLDQPRRPSPKRVLPWALAYAAIFGVSLYFNGLAYKMIFDQSHALARRPLADVLREVGGLFNTFLLILGYPKFGYLMWALVALQWRRPEARRLLFMVLVPLPVFLVVARLHASLAFSPQYLSAFGGLQLAAMVLALSKADQLWRKQVQPRLKIRSERLAATIGIGLVGAYAFGTVDLIRFAAATKIPRLSPNFSNTFHTFEELRELARPLFIIDPCDSAERAKYYLRFNGNNPYRFGYDVVDLGCFVEPRQVVSLFETFLDAHPKGLVVFYSDTRPCPYRSFTANRSDGGTMQIRKTRTDDTCVWIAQGVRGWKDLEAAAKSVGWPDYAHFFQRIHTEGLVR